MEVSDIFSGLEEEFTVGRRDEEYGFWSLIVLEDW